MLNCGIFARSTVLGVILTVTLAAVCAGEDQGSKRMQAERLIRSGNIDKASTIYQELALHPDNAKVMAADDLAAAITLLRRQNKIRLLDEFRDKAAKALSKNRFALEILAYDYHNDPYHWGYLLNGRFQRGTGQLGNARPVCSFARDRARCLQLLAAAFGVIGKDEKDDSYGALCLKAAQAVLLHRGRLQPALLESLTDLTDLPPYEDGHDLRYTVPDTGSYTFPATFSGYIVPASWDAAASDGERWRFLLDQAETFGKRKEALTALGDFYGAVLGVQRYSQPDPDLIKEFKEQCKELTDSQTLIVGHGHIRVMNLPDTMNYLEIYKRAGANKRLATVYAARGQLSKAAEFLTVKERDEWQRVACEFVESGPILLTDAPAVTLAYRNSGTITFTARPIDFGMLWLETRQLLESKPRFIDPDEVGFAKLINRLFGRSARAMGEPAQTWTVELPKSPAYQRTEAEIPLPFKKPGIYLLEGVSGNTQCRRVVHLTDLAIARKNLENGVWLQVASQKTGQPIPNTAVELLGYTKVFKKGTLQVRTRQLQRTTNEYGEVILGKDDVTDDSGKTLHWTVQASQGEQIAYLDFSPFPSESPMEHPSNVLRAHIMTDHILYKPGDTVNYVAWLAVAGFASAPAEAPAVGSKVKAVISGPDKQRVYSEKHISDDRGALRGQYRLPETAARGTYYLYIPEAAATVSFTVAQLDNTVPELNVSCQQIRVSPGTPLNISLSVTELHTFAHGFTVNLSVQAQLDGKTSTQTIFEESYDIPPAKLADNSLNWKQDLTIPTMANQKGVYVIHAELVSAGAGYTRKHRIIASTSPGAVDLKLPANFLPANAPVELTLSPVLTNGLTTTGYGHVEIIQLAVSETSRKKDHIVHSQKIVIAEGDAAVITLPALPAGRYKLKAVVFPAEKDSLKQAPGQPADEPPVSPAQNTLPPAEALIGEQQLVIHDKGYVPGPAPDRLTVIPEKHCYSPKDVMKVLVMSPVPGGTVAVFVRPAIAYRRPQFLTLSGASGIVEIPIDTTDRPNMFVECLVFGRGKCYNAVRGITILPGEINLTLTADLAPLAQAGSRLTVPVSIEGVKDPKAVKLLAVVHNTVKDVLAPESGIHTQLRPWVRRHQPWTITSCDRRFRNTMKTGEMGMATLEFPFLKYDSAPALPEEPMADTAPLLTPLVQTDQGPRTIYWSEVTLNDGGKATINFRTPDTAGNWTLKLWAVNADVACGDWRGFFSTFTPINTTLSLPEIAAGGDRFQVNAVVVNTTEEDDFVALNLEVSNGLELTANIEKGFPLNAQESKALAPILIARKPGLHELALHVTSTAGDSVIRKQVRVAGQQEMAATKQIVVACDGIVTPLKLPLNATHLDWAVGFPGVMLQMLRQDLSESERIPEHLFGSVLIEAMTLKGVAAANYSVPINPKKPTEPGYWDKMALTARAKRAMLQLESMQNADGGWSWSGSVNLPSDPETSATVIHALQTARTYGLPISRTCLFRAIQYLRGIRSQRLAAFQSNIGTCNDTDAHIYLALIESKDKDHAMTPFLERDFGNLSFIAKCHFVLGLRKIFHYDKLGPLMAELREAITGSEDQSLRWVDTDQPLRDTAEFAQVLNHAEPGSELTKSVIRWLVTRRKTTSSWGSRRLDQLCAEAMASFIKQAEEEKPALKVTKAEKTPAPPIVNVTESARYTELLGQVALPEPGKGLALNVDGFGDLFASIPIKAKRVEGIETSISFASEEGRTRGFVAGNIIDTALTVKTNVDLERVAVQCVLPAGMVLLNAGKQVICSGPMTVNQRDGNTVTFLARRLDKGEHTIHFRAIATYPGTFTWHSPQLLIDGYPILHKQRRKGTCSIGRNPLDK